MVKSMVPKNVKRNVTNKDVKDAMKNGAKAVKVSPEQYQQEMTGKLRDKIGRQNEYMQLNLNANMKITRLKWMRKQIDSNKIEWKIYESPMPLDMMVCQYDMELYEYKRILTRLEYLKQALKNDGMTPEDINKLERGEYVKDEKKLKEIDLNEKEQKPEYVG